MKSPTSIVRQLPGHGLSWTGRGALWQADDHLLEVTSLFMLEKYRRFFFCETRAFVVRRTNVRFISALLQGGLAGICFLLAWGAREIGVHHTSEDWRVMLFFTSVILGALAVLSLVALGVNLLLGPSCRCHILNATGWHELAAPARLNPALRVQALIFPLIEAAQTPATVAAPATP
jgi:hypothetical protein